MTGRPPAPAHWIRPNEVTRQPKHWLFLDSEATIVGDDVDQVQSWRCAVTCYDHRHKGADDWAGPQWREHLEAVDLWGYVDTVAKKNARLVIVAHNLAYDLRITECFEHLTAAGWSLDRIRLDSEQTQVRWRQDSRTIVMVDSLSWWPVALATLGDELGIDKPPLPAQSDDMGYWLARCRADVEILRTAYLRMLAWFRSEDLGTWQPTGAGQSWSAWRHRFMSDQVLVGNDLETREMERAAVYCGRSEAWRHGRQRGGPFAEWDVESAYLRIMRDCEVPTKLVGRRVDPKPCDVDHWRAVARCLCRVRVTTADPLVPVATDAGIVWPVGTFDTVLWDPELDLLDAAGVDYRVTEIVVYHSRPALRAFAEWLWPFVNGDDAELDPVARRTAKHWSRAFVGRFGVRYTEWLPWGEALTPGVRLSRAVDLDTDERYRLLSDGHTMQREGRLIEGENAVPSVMGWIMSETRRRLWVTMTDAGLENVLHVDTDGLLVNAEGSRRLATAGKAGIRVKGEYRSVDVIAPRQVVYGGQIRAPGVPRKSIRTGERTWEGVAWERLTTSLGSGELDTVRVGRRTVTLRGRDRRRLHLPDGSTAPLTLDVTGAVA